MLMPDPDDLSALERTHLDTLWHHLNAKPLPKGLGKTLAGPILAYDLQCQKHKGLDRQTKAALRQAQTHRTRTTLPPPGTQLVREWEGARYIVAVTASGYSWNGKTWRSLSAIARAITGAHWSGPRFFGLVHTQNAKT